MGTICFAGGCFWGMEALFRRMPGVAAVTAGYANGDSEAHANYDDVCTGLTGFRETVQVEYDDTVISLPQLLFTFFAVELKPLACFYPAEPHHQRYLEKHPRGYCHVAPWKLAALPDYPFSTADYDRPAKVLLRAWTERRETEP